MLKKRILSLTGCLLLLSVPIAVRCQLYTTTDSGKGRGFEKLAVNKVPKVVTETFNKEYPVLQDGNWYGYPQFGNGSDWYEYDPSYYSNENPENYVVEFTHHDTLDRVIYTKTGEKIATHRKTNVVLPSTVTNAIRNGTYKTWSVGDDREEVFQHSATDKIKVYRVTVRKGREMHTLYYQANGKLLRIVRSVTG